MAKRQLVFMQIENVEQMMDTQSFQKNFETALLLSLLKRNLLTQWQFEQCQEQIKKTKRFKKNTRRST